MSERAGTSVIVDRLGHRVVTATFGLVALWQWIVLVGRLCSGYLGVTDAVPHLTGLRLATRGGGAKLYSLADQATMQASLVPPPRTFALRTYLYPPQLTVVLRPLSVLSSTQLHLLLLLANIVGVAVFARWLTGRVAWSRREWSIAIAIAMSFAPLVSVFQQAQFAGIYLGVCASLARSLENARWWRGAFALLVLSWKPPIFVLLVLGVVACRVARPVIWRLAVLLGVTGSASVAWFGTDVVGSYLSMVRSSSAVHVGFVHHSYMATVRSLLQHWGVGAETAARVNTCVFALVAVVVVMVWRRSELAHGERVALTLALGACGSMYQFPYDVALVLFSMALLWDRVRAAPNRDAWVAALVGAHTLCFAGLFAAQLRVPAIVGAFIVGGAWLLSVYRPKGSPAPTTTSALSIDPAIATR